MKESILIAGLKQKNKIVFDYVFNYYYSSLCAFSLQYINNKETVEDLVQDFFVSLWLEAENFNIKISLKAYLFTSVKNRCLDAIKHRKVNEKYKNFILYNTSDIDKTSETFYAESELRQAIQNSLAKLPPRCREIFELSRLNGLSNQDISEKLSISKRTVELQISNSLKVLRHELAEFMPVFMLFCLLK